MSHSLPDPASEDGRSFSGQNGSGQNGSGQNGSGQNGSGQNGPGYNGSGQGNTEPDPTKVTNQPALTTSTGRIWLIMGGLFAVIAAVVLIALLPFAPHGLAAAALAVVVLLYAAMVITQLLTRRGRARLGVLAALMLAIAGVALVCILIIAASQIPST